MSISAVDVDKTIEKVESYKDKSLRLPKPSGYKILVALPNIEERTEGWIIKPDSVIEKDRLIEGNGKPEVGSWNAGDAVVAAGHGHPSEGKPPDDHAKGQCDHEEVNAARMGQQ